MSNKSQGRQQSRKITQGWNSNKRKEQPKKPQHYLDKFNASIEVRNNDVNKALRVLKKRLEKITSAIFTFAPFLVSQLFIKECF